MTTHPRCPAGPEALGGGLATAALLVLGARWLSLSWPWRDSGLGIVSATTLRRYPPQLELLWFALAAGSGIALLWWAAGRLRERTWKPGPTATVEALGAGALAAALMLPRPAATAAVVLAIGALVWCAARRPVRPGTGAGQRAPNTTQTGAPGAGRGAAWVLAWAAALAAVVLLRTPRLLRGIRLVSDEVPDELLVSSGWVFQVELGQHLAWADGLQRGLLHGRDLFCLYGPLYDWLGVAFWELFSRSIGTWYLYDGFSEAAGLAALALCTATLVRRPGLALLAPLLVSTVSLRLGLPLLGLAALVRWIQASGAGEARAAGWAAAAGFAAGLGLLYSQEFALAFGCCAALAFTVRAAPRAALVFSGALLLSVAPVLAAYAAAGALGPMLRDLAAYPGYVMAGYGNLPYPSLRDALPLWPWPGGAPEDRLLRLAYLVPAWIAAAFALALPAARLDPSGARASLAGLFRRLGETTRLPLILVALMGLIGFRSALGRSDELHIHALLPIVAVLVIVGLDRLLDSAGRGARAGLLAGRLALGVALLWAGGLLPSVAVVDSYYAKTSVQELRRLAGEEIPRAAPELRVVNRVVDWVRAHSAPDDAVLFLPNNAAYYYLTERPNPTRFAVSHQIPTNAHRAEVLADLRRRPPQLMVWDDSSRPLDRISDRRILGDEIMDWLDDHYVPATRIGPVRILRFASDPSKAAAGRAADGAP